MLYAIGGGGGDVVNVAGCGWEHAPGCHVAHLAGAAAVQLLGWASMWVAGDAGAVHSSSAMLAQPELGRSKCGAPHCMRNLARCCGLRCHAAWRDGEAAAICRRRSEE
jgi:hypothetical protein